MFDFPDRLARRVGAKVARVQRGASAGAARSRAASVLTTAMIAAATLLAASLSAIAQTSQERQAQCELSAIRDTRSALAIQFIRSACNWLALNGDSLLNESSKRYHVCLVRQLSGVQANEAASAIVSACRTSYPP